MFDLELPWWNLVARASLVYVALLVLMRLSGKRTVGQLTPFELLVVMLLSESVSASLAGGDNSVGAALILATTLIGLNALIAWSTSRSKRLLQCIEGQPILIGRNGRMFRNILQSQNVSIADVRQALREADCSMVDMRCAILEANGKISILKKPADSS